MEVMTAAGRVYVCCLLAQAERQVLLWVCTPVSLVVAKASQRVRELVLSLCLVRIIFERVYNSTVLSVKVAIAP